MKQTTCPPCKNLMRKLCIIWLNNCIRFFNECMNTVLRCIRDDIDQECSQKCKEKVNIYNATNEEISKKNLKYLSKGLNFTPHFSPDTDSFGNDVENLLKGCCNDPGARGLICQLFGKECDI